MKNSLVRQPSTFNQIANIAMVNCFLNKYTGYISKKSKTYTDWIKYINDGIQNGNIKTSNFRCPTSCQTGYFNVLKLIAEFEFNGIKRSEICRKLNVKSLNRTFDCLEYAGLIKLDRAYTHKFYVTPFGLSYLAAVNEQFNV